MDRGIIVFAVVLAASAARADVAVDEEGGRWLFAVEKQGRWRFSPRPAGAPWIRHLLDPHPALPSFLPEGTKWKMRLVPARQPKALVLASKEPWMRPAAFEAIWPVQLLLPGSNSTLSVGTPGSLAFDALHSCAAIANREATALWAMVCFETGAVFHAGMSIRWSGDDVELFYDGRRLLRVQFAARTVLVEKNAQPPAGRRPWQRLVSTGWKVLE